MTRRKSAIERLVARTRAAWIALAAFAVVVGALAPPGWMPSQSADGEAWSFAWCGDASRVATDRGRDDSDGGAPRSTDVGAPCAFAFTPAAAQVPDAEVVALTPPPALRLGRSVSSQWRGSHARPRAHAPRGPPRRA